ncbi:MAG: DUF3500 domain-containing protein [Gemmataceae bacterium]
MKLARFGVAMSAFVVVAGVAAIAQVSATAGLKMADAAKKYLDGLTAEQRAKGAFSFDSPEREKWAFVPLQDKDKKPTRKGLRLEEMTASQREAAMALLQTGLSQSGYKQATTIMSLEAILRDLEKGGANVRNPDWYFVTIFGTPANSGKWGWRVEGHHLSLNFTVENGQVTSATPCFFGANPATVLAGDRKGLRATPEVDDLAAELFTSLDDEQKKLAIQSAQLPEVVANSAANLGQPKGIPAAKLTDAQRSTLKRLIEAYTNRLPAEIAQAELGRIESAGFAKIYFAYAGSPGQGNKHSYRLHGPTFAAEFVNVQDDSAKNPANHIHSAWRHLPKDFALAN